jgi:ubiquinone/menaquinone biosynthesis C-methylase UbiE
MTSEVQSIRERYSRRDHGRDARIYHPTHPAALMSAQERERVLARWLRRMGADPAALKLVEVGCGTGRILLDFLRLGFRPEHLLGNDLLPARIEEATVTLPAAVRLVCCDAMDLEVEKESCDVVVQSTVFTSIQDRDFQKALARRMWSWVAPGGGVLWYDFVYDNPRNPDVKGVPVARIRELFPECCEFQHWRLTLAPPLSRLVTRVHPFCYQLFNLVPLLRTHVLCWIRKAP